jgi:hypothetical protein
MFQFSLPDMSAESPIIEKQQKNNYQQITNINSEMCKTQFP